MKRAHKVLHMQAAYVYANGSYCVRRKVGCLIVKNNTPIAIGFNGTPPGDENVCEDINGFTKDTVIHAERNAFLKLKGRDEDLSDACIFVTTAPCENCAKLILDSGIKTVYYNDLYRCDKGVRLLIDNGVRVEKIEI